MDSRGLYDLRMSAFWIFPSQVVDINGESFALVLDHFLNEEAINALILLQENANGKLTTNTIIKQA